MAAVGHLENKLLSSEQNQAIRLLQRLIENALEAIYKEKDCSLFVASFPTLIAIVQKQKLEKEELAIDELFSLVLELCYQTLGPVNFEKHFPVMPTFLRKCYWRLIQNPIASAKKKEVASEPKTGHASSAEQEGELSLKYTLANVMQGNLEEAIKEVKAVLMQIPKAKSEILATTVNFLLLSNTILLAKKEQAIKADLAFDLLCFVEQHIKGFEKKESPSKQKANPLPDELIQRLEILKQICQLDHQEDPALIFLLDSLKSSCHKFLGTYAETREDTDVFNDLRYFLQHYSEFSSTPMFEIFLNLGHIYEKFTELHDYFLTKKKLSDKELAIVRPLLANLKSLLGDESKSSEKRKKLEKLNHLLERRIAEASSLPIMEIKEIAEALTLGEITLPDTKTGVSVVSPEKYLLNFIGDFLKVAANDLAEGKEIKGTLNCANSLIADFGLNNNHDVIALYANFIVFAKTLLPSQKLAKMVPESMMLSVIRYFPQLNDLSALEKKEDLKSEGQSRQAGTIQASAGTSIVTPRGMASVDLVMDGKQRSQEPDATVEVKSQQKEQKGVNGDLAKNPAKPQPQHSGDILSARGVLASISVTLPSSNTAKAVEGQDATSSPMQIATRADGLALIEQPDGAADATATSSSALIVRL